MKNLIIKITSFYLSFFIGVIVSIGSTLGNLPQIEVVSDNFSPIKTTVCKISDYSNDFNGKLVKFKATAYANQNKLILLPMECLMPGDNFYLYPTLDLKNYNGTHNNLLNILQSDTPLIETREDTTAEIDKNSQEVDILVIGIVKEFYDNEGHKLFSIMPKKIEIISTFRKFTPKGAA